MREINRAKIEGFKADALLALQGVATAYGVTIKGGTGTFSPTQATVKFELSVIQANGDTTTPEAEAFAQWSYSYKLAPEDMGGLFTVNGTAYRITGLKTRRPKYPICAERVSDGRAFKFPRDAIKTIIHK